MQRDTSTAGDVDVSDRLQPIAFHFHEVRQRIFIATPESVQRQQILKTQVAQLYPVSRLLEDVGITFHVQWIRE